MIFVSFRILMHAYAYLEYPPVLLRRPRALALGQLRVDNMVPVEHALQYRLWRNLLLSAQQQQQRQQRVR